MKKILTFVIAAASFCVFADKVTLKSGSFLTGETGAIKDGVLKFKSDDLGDIEIKLANIKEIDRAKKHVVQYKDNRCEERILTVKNGELHSGDGKFDRSNVKAIDPVAETWHGNVNVGYEAARGNTYKNAASVVANANRRWEKDRLNIDFAYHYGENGTTDADNKKTEDRWDIEAKHDHFWLPKVYNYEDLKWERDMIRNMRARYRVGLGGGYQWLENSLFESTGKWSFNQEIGVNWIKEDYEDNDDVKENGFASLRYAHHLNYIPKWTDKLEFFHNLEYLPEVDDWDKYLVKANIGFSTQIIGNFNLLGKIEWDYDSKPASDLKKDDLRYILGLGYKW